MRIFLLLFILVFENIPAFCFILCLHHYLYQSSAQIAHFAIVLRIIFCLAKKGGKIYNFVWFSFFFVLFTIPMKKKTLISSVWQMQQRKYHNYSIKWLKKMKNQKEWEAEGESEKRIAKRTQTVEVTLIWFVSILCLSYCFGANRTLQLRLILIYSV